jgi:hypothetical protein
MEWQKIIHKLIYWFVLVSFLETTLNAVEQGFWTCGLHVAHQFFYVALVILVWYCVILYDEKVTWFQKIHFVNIVSIWQYL